MPTKRRNPPPPQWVVTHTVPSADKSTVYRLVHTQSQETIYVSCSQEQIRHYARFNEKSLPQTTRTEIEQAIIRYLMEGGD